MTKVKVGVIGTGWAATARHIPSYRRHPDAEVTILFDRRPERARAVAQQLRIARAVSTIEEFFSEEIDLVSICTPPWTHAELGCAALEAGKHVFTEKPMAMNVGEAQAMVDTAERAGRLLCVSHNFLYSRAVNRADQLLAGDVVSYASALQLSSLRRRLPTWYAELPGGLLLDESPHMLYTLQHFLGPLDLHGARATFDPHSGLPKNVEIRLQGPSAMAHLTMLFDTPVSEWHVGLVAGQRCVDLDLFRDITVSVTSDGAHRPLDILRTSARLVSDHAAGFASSGARYAAGRLFWGHDAVIGRFVDAALGRCPTPVPSAEAVGIVRLTDEILVELGLRSGSR